MISSQALSNTILKKSFSENVSVSPMKLQKLIYFIYKEYAQKFDEPLFSEDFQAWDYGPVVRSVYDEFKSFRAGRITRFAKDANNKVYILNRNKVSNLCDIIDKIWRKYCCYTGVELSKITHREGSAWYKAYMSHKPCLDYGDIVNDYTDECRY